MKRKIMTRINNKCSAVGSEFKRMDYNDYYCHCFCYYCFLPPVMTDLLLMTIPNDKFGLLQLASLATLLECFPVTVFKGEEL